MVDSSLVNVASISTSSPETDLRDNQDEHKVAIALLRLASIGGTVWHDDNRNGQIDETETLLEGITMFLTGQDIFGTNILQTTTTDGNGEYSFQGLVPGTYNVEQDQPPGLISTTVTGSDGVTDIGDVLKTAQSPQVTVADVGAVGIGTQNAANQAYNGIALIGGDKGLDYNYGEDFGSISGTVWEDRNDNSLLDPLDTAVANVAVRLYLDKDGNNMFSSTTDSLATSTISLADGSYRFELLPAGRYFVLFDSLSYPANYGLVEQGVGSHPSIDSDPDTVTTAAGPVDLAPGQEEDQIDAGLELKTTFGSIGDFVWNDLNENGIQDPGEPGVEDVTVNLFLYNPTTKSGTLTDTKQTGADGTYLFEDVVAGQMYYLGFDPSSLPACFKLTVQDAGTGTNQDELDSDPDPTTGFTSPFLLETNELDTIWDTGIVLEVPVLKANLAATVCSDVETDLILDTEASSIPAATYNIVSITTQAGLDTVSGNASAGDGQAADALGLDKFTNKTTGPLTVTYRVSPVSADSCRGDTVEVIVTINPEPVLATGLDTTVCSNAISGILLDTDSGAVAAAEYEIVTIDISTGLNPVSGNSSVGPGQAATAILNDRFVNTTASILTVSYAIIPKSAQGCEGDTGHVVLQVEPGLAMNPNLDTAICSGVPAGIVLSTTDQSATGLLYDIISISVDSQLTPGTGNALIGDAQAENVLANDQFTNIGSTPRSVIYEVSPISSKGCRGDTLSVTLTIGVQAFAPNANTTSCSGDTVNFDLQGHVNAFGNGSSSSFSWLANPVAGVTGISTTPQAGSNIDDVLINTTNQPQTVVYTVTPTSGVGNCASANFTVSVRLEASGQITVLPSNVCPAYPTDLASLMRDYTLNVRRVSFYDGDPDNGGSLLGTPRMVRGTAFRRDRVIVRPTVTTTYWVKSVSASGCESVQTFVVTVEQNCNALLAPVAMLEGAFDPTMGRQRSQLQQAALIPATEPYTGLGYNFVGGGGEQMNLAPNLQSGIVDWVVVEVRDASDPGLILHSRAALLLDDGRIVAMDGMSQVSLNAMPAGRYYIAIIHRNHLGIMSANPVTMGTSIDFSNPSTQVYGNTPMRVVKNGKALLFSGDADGNGQIQNTDDVLRWIPSAGSSGYHRADYNLDGQVQNSDRVFNWMNNVGRGTALPD